MSVISTITYPDCLLKIEYGNGDISIYNLADCTISKSRQGIVIAEEKRTTTLTTEQVVDYGTTVDALFTAMLAEKALCEDSGGGGGITPINITHSALMIAMRDQTLTPGAMYRLTDYKSVNYLNGYTAAYDYLWGSITPTDPNFDPYAIHEGDTEVIVLKALTAGTFEPIAYSESHPRDIIEFMPEVDSIGIAWDYYTGGETIDATPIADFNLSWNADEDCAQIEIPNGFKVLWGHAVIIYTSFNSGADVIDVQIEPLTFGAMTPQYIGNQTNVDATIEAVDDGATILLRGVDATLFANYDTDSLYVAAGARYDAGGIGGPAYGWITRRTDTERDISMPADFRGRMYRRFEVDLSALITGITTWYYGIGDDFRGQGTTGNYLDVGMLNDANVTQPMPYRRGYINGAGGPENSYFSYNGLADNFVLLQTSKNFEFGERCFDSTYNKVTDVSISGSSAYNNALQFTEVVASGDLRNNNCNTVTSCEFSVSSNSNTFNTFQFNHVMIALLAQNFNASTHVNSTYSCYLSRNAGAATRLFYMNAGNAYTTATITS